MPSKGHGVGWWSGWDPQREDADQDAAEVGEKVGRVSHDGQTVGSISTYRWGNDTTYE